MFCPMYGNWVRCTKTGQLRSFGKNAIILKIHRSSSQSLYILNVNKWAISERNFRNFLFTDEKIYSDYKLKCTETGQRTVGIV